MKRLLLALLLLASTASARTYWVSPTTDATAPGNDAYNGSDTVSTGPVNGPTTLSWFNANAVPGDVCRFKSGDYGQVSIAPRNNGTSADRIRYYGFPQDPQGVRVANIHFGDGGHEVLRGSHCTVRWVKTTSQFTGVFGIYGNLPTADSLVRCISSVASNLQIYGDSCVVDSVTLTGAVTSSDTDAQPVFLLISGDRYPSYNILNQAVANTVKNSSFTWTFTGNDDCHGVKTFFATNNVIFNNTFNITKASEGGFFFGLQGYRSSYNLIQGNTWNVSCAATGGTRAVWSNRDSSFCNRFLLNTVTTSGAGQMSAIYPSNVGSYGNSTYSNYFGFNTITVPSVSTGSGVVYWQNGLRGDTLEFNSLVTSSTNPLMLIYPGMDNSGGVIRHNSFFTAGPTAVDLTGGTGSQLLSTRLASNVYYCQTANSSSAPNVDVPTSVQIDSAGVFFSLGAATAANAIRVGSVFGAPGSGTWFGGARSKWCSPRYADSTYDGGADLTFDGRVTDAGCAVGPVWRDGYVGIGKSGGDATDPVVTITSPTDTSYTWSAYETMPLVWTASDNVAVTSQTIQYGEGTVPGAWHTIVSGLSGATTTYSWVLPELASTLPYATFRITAYDAAGGSGVDTQVFKINVVSPNRRGFDEYPGPDGPP